MISTQFKQSRFIKLFVLAVLFSFLFVISAGVVFAGDFILNWSQIGFVDGTSSLQTFTNVDNSGVDMTTEFRVLNSAFQDIGIYIPGTSPLNLGMPKPDGDALAVRDISLSDYPGADVGYILTTITFSPSISIDELWVEPFYNWTAEGVRKHMALQAFDGNGNGLAPVSWSTYGGSDLIVEPHPSNGEPWFRSSYPNGQTTYSGGFEISYTGQQISELHWYSWGLATDDSFSHLLGSSLLGDFQFTPEVPTAIHLVSIGAAVGDSNVLIPILLAILLVSLTTVIIVRQRPLKKR